MSNMLDKILKSIISEIVEAIFFIICLYIAYLLPEDNIRKSIINTIIGLWAIAGIGTPLVIFAELEKEVAKFIQHIR